jgi:hypothetical protein
MGFDTKAFMQTQFAPRTARVDVPGLADWFVDAEPVWVVRGQTANEVALANAASEKHKAVDSIVKAIADNADKVSAIKKAIGIAGDTPADIIKRLEQLVQCSVEPVITLDLAVKLAEVRPVEFYVLTNEILKLTGLGMDLKKPKASGNPTKSEDS